MKRAPIVITATSSASNGLPCVNRLAPGTLKLMISVQRF
jgi:hypothetical protein